MQPLVWMARQSLWGVVQVSRDSLPTLLGYLKEAAFTCADVVHVQFNLILCLGPQRRKYKAQSRKSSEKYSKLLQDILKDFERAAGG